MDTIVIVLGKNYSTSLSVIRALGKVDYHIELYYIANRKNESQIAASSKYVKRTIEHLGRKDESIVEELCNVYADPQIRYVLMPTDDYTSSLIDRFRNRLSGQFIMPFIEGKGQGAITSLMDKTVQSQLAVDAGMDVAASWSIYLPVNGDICIPEDIPFPCFLKPIVSAKGYKFEICKCSSRNELLSKLGDMRKRMPNREVLVQEFLDISEEFAISGACIDQDIFIPAVNRKIIVGKHERGVTIIGEISDTKIIQLVYEKIVSFLKSLHYTGLFDIDLIRCGDKIYFGEINFRSSGIGYSVINAGANLPLIVVMSLIGEKWRDIDCTVTKGLKFFYDKTGWEDAVYGKRSWKEIEDMSRQADFSLIDVKDDPLPGKIFMQNMVMNYRKQQLVRLLPFKVYKKVMTRILYR